MSIVNAGDLDSNGYNDVIIGAPNEKLSDTDVASGAIYVYYSSQAGLDFHRFQVRILLYCHIEKCNSCSFFVEYLPGY